MNKYYRYLYQHIEQTSIAVSKKSKEQWLKFKNHPNESFNDMNNRILKFAKEDAAIRILKKTDNIQVKPFAYLERLSNSYLYKFRVRNYRIIVDVINENWYYILY